MADEIRHRPRYLDENRHVCVICCLGRNNYRRGHKLDDKKSHAQSNIVCRFMYGITIHSPTRAPPISTFS